MHPGSRHQTYSERIEKRRLLWWGRPNRGSARGYLDYLHRLKERVTLRTRNDSGQTWHSCCEFWQRTLIYKLNSREFARKYGCRVPDLYWSGRLVRNLPLNSLPENYVIKPNFASGRKGVYLMAAHKNLVDEKSYTDQELREDLEKKMVKIWNRPILVEEFVTTEQGEHKLPIEYRCHVFGDTIGAIHVLQRTLDKRETRFGLYSTNWEFLKDQPFTAFPPADYVPPPKCLDEMLVFAKQLGKAYGTYVRVDLFSSLKGCVFGEFSSTPGWGKGSEDVDELFGALWQEKLGDKI